MLTSNARGTGWTLAAALASRAGRTHRALLARGPGRSDGASFPLEPLAASCACRSRRARDSLDPLIALLTPRSLRSRLPRRSPRTSFPRCTRLPRRARSTLFAWRPLLTLGALFALRSSRSSLSLRTRCSGLALGTSLALFALFALRSGGTPLTLGTWLPWCARRAWFALRA